MCSHTRLKLSLILNSLQWGFNNKQVLTNGFVDDTTFYVDGEEHNFHNVQCMVQEFCELSSVIINWNKSIGIRIKNNRVPHWLPHPNFQWLQHWRSLQYLGCQIGVDITHDPLIDPLMMLLF